MLSKEEIEKILDQNEDIITYKADKDFRCLTSSEKTLLENNKKIKEYTDQLEQENKTLTHTNKSYKGMLNKQNKMIDKMAKQIDKLQFIAGPDKDCFIPREYSDINDCIKKSSCVECLKQYFEKKAEEK